MPGGASRSQRLWAILLVLDSFFVIVFGGALAAKVYQHWQATPAPVEPPLQTKTPPPPEKPAEEPPKAEQALPPEAPAAAPSVPAKPAAPPTPAEKPAAEKPAPEKPPAAKAVPVQFQLKTPEAQGVALVGAFIVRGGKKPMVDRGEGRWTVTLYLTPNTYRYNFLVDGKKILDPENPKAEREASVLIVPQP